MSPDSGHSVFWASCLVVSPAPSSPLILSHSAPFRGGDPHSSCISAPLHATLRGWSSLLIAPRVCPALIGSGRSVVGVMTHRPLSAQHIRRATG
eukprot:3684522-Pyramimonas_sp.AAC.1